MATQSKNKAAPSISIDSQATGWQDLTDSLININATNDVASQVIYSSTIDTLYDTADVNNVEPIANIENDAEAIPADLPSAKIHYSLALNSEPISDTPIDDENVNPDTISSIENDETLTPIDNLNSDSDQILIAADETAVVNEEPDVNVSESVWFMHSESRSTMVWIEPTTYFVYGEDESKSIDIEGSVIVTSTDDSLFDDIDYSEQPIVDCATPVDEGILAGESTGLSFDLSAYTKPFIIYDDSYFEKAIDEEYVADELTDPVIDADIISIDLAETDFEIIEETTGDLFYEFIEEPIDDVAPIDEIVTEESFIIDDTLYEEYIIEEYNLADPVIDADPISIDQAETDFEIIDDLTEELLEDYETPNDKILVEDDYIFDESIDLLIEGTEVYTDSYLIDNNTDPLLETIDVTDEPLLIYSFVSCWTTNFTLILEGFSIMNLIVEDTSIELQTETASDDLTIVPLGLPVSTDWIA